MEINKSCFLFCLFLWFSLQILIANAEVHYHDFVVQAKPVKRLCHTRSIITVNGQFPGPTLKVRNGDSLVVKVVNQAKYNITIHWHGIRQMRNGWADGPSYVTQCPIQPGGTYTYRFKIENQEGTLWWHAHSSWLRATVYGALIILPKKDTSYPFATPKREFPVILGEWWNSNPIDVIRQALKTGAAPNNSDAFTINGQPGDLYKCSSKETTVLPVGPGETILLRLINAAMVNELFFSVADHKMTVVAADASYTKPFTTSVILLGPGQTNDVLIQTNQPAGRYYLAAHAYESGPPNTPFDNTTTTAILSYENQITSTQPKPAALPAFNDTATAAAFTASIKSPRPVKIPGPVNENLFFTVGLGLFNCPPGKTCSGPNGTRFTASMNNYSFVLPKRQSLLQAAEFGIPGVFTTDFPATPPVKFDYTGNNISPSLYQPVKATKLYPLKYGSVVQLVMQGTNIVASEEHPMHIHGYEFYVLATGTGNFNAKKDTAKFNLVDPPRRNTIGVPVKGWAVIRFVADNPGVWFVHCHIDSHLTWGLAMAFLVENGVGKLQSTIPPPLDLPKC
ncbi:Laccase-3 [Dendrobium catenatum]|uniref:Laccase n=2 Tax=Dendrobium catenatum TaxID=906689 RepID=A0A2I0VX47_9ASPA|nr:Laccase-3 [Dendrobium catenatum]